MDDHLDRFVDRKGRNWTPGQVRNRGGVGEETALFDSLERISVYLELIDHAETRAQALAGMAGTALGVFFAAFIAAFVTESSNHSAILKVADLVSEVLFVAGAFLLLRCIFQSLRPMEIHDPWDEHELELHWREVERIQESAARSFWVGTVALAISIGILIAADVLIDLGAFYSPIGA